FKSLALVCASFGIISLMIDWWLYHNIRRSFLLTLDFWLAAGLLHLSQSLDWKSISSAALTVIVRKLYVCIISEKDL
ncbi:MAG: hypothetical protein ACXVB4_17175, partial [Pseudobdellovibrionaceae bacterium]